MSKDIIDRTIEEFNNEYGAEKNLIVLVEELAELQQAVCKYIRWEAKGVLRKDKNEIMVDIRSEVADVLYSMRYLCGITGNTWSDFMEMTADKAFENQKRLHDKIEKRESTYDTDKSIG